MELTPLQRAKTSLNLKLMREMIEMRTSKTVSETFKEMFNQTRDRNLLTQLAQILTLSNSKSETAQILSRDLNLKPEEERSLERIMDKF